MDVHPCHHTVNPIPYRRSHGPRHHQTNILCLGPSKSRLSALAMSFDDALPALANILDWCDLLTAIRLNRTLRSDAGKGRLARRLIAERRYREYEYELIATVFDEYNVFYKMPDLLDSDVDIPGQTLSPDSDSDSDVDS